MKLSPGNLVQITRASIGVPLDSVGLILEKSPPGDDINGREYPRDYTIYIVQLAGAKVRAKYPRRYLARDLKVIS